ncbi:ABC transporter permease subunit [Roseomonas terrae]|uniref:ABC transporter permease subunit n=2 Tax=Neoroseomonas terrae TaxID=424799 RepID=A0ABS5EIA0_9PROT|nr:ABC transporter permease subunit [Neoroseomonas terrae]MBR0650747.1 ABC transporter permease subunit [Neoroseomonas terrae]
MGAGYVFLWLPIILLVAYAFSADRIPFQWGGFSLQWFVALAANERVVEAALLSLRIAAGAATLAVLLGGAAGWALARYGRFRGRAIFGALIGAPLVLPEVVTGLSLLLLFVALESMTGWPEGRGAFTVLLAHATLGAAFVAVVVQSRLAETDRSLEEAAMDLGATPFTAFRTVTLPLIAPALAAGWLLAFTLSLDDVVIASFVSGPQGTTLPMALFAMLRRGLTPEVNALGAVVVLGVGAMLAVAALLLRGRGDSR